VAAASLAELRARVREAADMEGSAFVADAASSLDAWINEGVDEVYDVLVCLYGDDYFAKSAALTTVAGQSVYSLPLDFYKLLMVELPFNGDQVTLRKFQFSERNAYANWTRGAGLPRYRLEGNKLRLLPAPDSVLAGNIWYIQTRAKLVQASDAVDFPGNWEELAVAHAAAKCAVKEETDPSPHLLAKQQARARLEMAAPVRDAGEPEKVVDTDLPYTGRHPRGEWGWL
jgi:hypothetical protein